MSSQAAQPTTKVPTHITPTQSTTEKETTTPTTDTQKPSKLICQFLDASNHFWAYLSVILNSSESLMILTHQRTRDINLHHKKNIFDHGIQESFKVRKQICAMSTLD